MKNILFLLTAALLLFLCTNLGAQTPELAKDSKGNYGFKLGDKWIIKAQYQDAKAFSDGLAAVNQNGLWGFIDTNGKYILKLAYKDVRSFQYGKALVLENGTRWQYINKKGETVFSCSGYDECHDFYKNIAFVKNFTGYSLINDRGETILKYIEKFGAWENDLCKIIIKEFARTTTEYAYINDKGEIIGIRSLIDFDLQKAPCLVSKKDEKNTDNIVYTLLDKDGKLLTDWYGLLESAGDGYYWFGTQFTRFMDTTKVYRGILSMNKKLFEVTAESYYSKGFLSPDIAYLFNYNNYYYYHIPSGKSIKCENLLQPVPNGYIAQINGLFGIVDKSLTIIQAPQFEKLVVLKK